MNCRASVLPSSVSNSCNRRSTWNSFFRSRSIPTGVSVTIRFRRLAGSICRTKSPRFSRDASICDTDAFVTARYSRTDVRSVVLLSKANCRINAYSGIVKSVNPLFLPNSAFSKLLRRNKEWSKSSLVQVFTKKSLPFQSLSLNSLALNYYSANA